MLFDHRTYTCRPGTIKKQLAFYEEHGMAAQKRHLGEPVFYGMTETGDPNTYVHVWVYADAGDRERKRAAMTADPQWQAFIDKSGELGYLIGQRNQLMIPAPFFDSPVKPK